MAKLSRHIIGAGFTAVAGGTRHASLSAIIHVQGGESSARTATAGQGREGELDMTNTNLSFLRFQRCGAVVWCRYTVARW